jgi:NDP-sugar pyrophosphorylase family protein
MSTAESDRILTSADFKRIRGIVLAGGYSWSNSAFDRLAPRPLLLVADWPLISYALGWLQDGGVANATLCINRETRSLKTRLTGHIPADLMNLHYQEDSMPRGPAGCARDAAMEGDADTFIVVDGTAIPSVDLGDLLHRHRVSGAALTVVAHHEATPGGRSGRQVPCGTYIIERRALDRVKTVGYIDIKENLIPTLYASGERVLTYSLVEPSPRVLDFATYLSANEWMIQRLADHEGSSSLHARETFVAADAVLVGPVLLGRNVRVMSGATIVGPTSIGDGSIVRSGALVSRSVVWSHCVVGQEAVADRCLLADGAVIEARTHVLGAVKGGLNRELRDAPATRESSSFADLLRRGLAAKPIHEAVTDSGTPLALS